MLLDCAAFRPSHFKATLAPALVHGTFDSSLEPARLALLRKLVEMRKLPERLKAAFESGIVGIAAPGSAADSMQLAQQQQQQHSLEAAWRDLLSTVESALELGSSDEEFGVLLGRPCSALHAALQLSVEPDTVILSLDFTLLQMERALPCNLIRRALDVFGQAYVLLMAQRAFSLVPILARALMTVILAFPELLVPLHETLWYYVHDGRDDSPLHNDMLACICVCCCDQSPQRATLYADDGSGQDLLLSLLHKFDMSHGAALKSSLRWTVAVLQHHVRLDATVTVAKVVQQLLYAAGRLAALAPTQPSLARLTRAATVLCNAHPHFVQGVERLAVAEWLELELQMGPATDALSAMQRLQYLAKMVAYYCTQTNDIRRTLETILETVLLGMAEGRAGASDAGLVLACAPWLCEAAASRKTPFLLDLVGRLAAAPGYPALASFFAAMLHLAPAALMRTKRRPALWEEEGAKVLHIYLYHASTVLLEPTGALPLMLTVHLLGAWHWWLEISPNSSTRGAQAEERQLAHARTVLFDQHLRRLELSAMVHWDALSAMPWIAGLLPARCEATVRPLSRQLSTWLAEGGADLAMPVTSSGGQRAIPYVGELWFALVWRRLEMVFAQHVDPAQAVYTLTAQLRTAFAASDTADTDLGQVRMAFAQALLHAGSLSLASASPVPLGREVQPQSCTEALIPLFIALTDTSPLLMAALLGQETALAALPPALRVALAGLRAEAGPANGPQSKAAHACLAAGWLLSQKQPTIRAQPALRQLLLSSYCTLLAGHKPFVTVCDQQRLRQMLLCSAPVSVPFGDGNGAGGDAGEVDNGNVDWCGLQHLDPEAFSQLAGREPSVPFLENSEDMFATSP